MSFKKYIKAVGTGPKGNRELEDFEIQDAIKQILERTATDSQIGAFLIAWRTRLESNSELKAMVKAIKEKITFSQIDNSIELGYSFDGRCNNPFLFPLFENILSEFYEKNPDIQELNLVISGDFLQPAKDGLTTKELYENMKENKHIYFFNRRNYCRALSDLTQLRHELGLRTAFNTVEKLLNPSLSKYGVTTAFHKPYVSKYLDIFGDYFEKITVVKASEGSPEVFKNGKYWQSIDGEIVEVSFKLEDFGITYDKEYENITLQEALDIVNNPSDEIMKLAKFNIALYLVFANRVDTLQEAWDRLNK